MKQFFKISIFTFFTTYYLIHATCVRAASEFSTSYNIEYTVDSKGDTTTRQQITLKNLYENIYATQYSIIIGSTNISNVTANDNFGEIQPEIKTESNSTKINLNFDKHIIGKDKQRNVTITYKTPDFATVKGQVLEVGFPLLQNSDDMDDYKVTIFIPNSFGKATQIIPTPNSETKNNSFNGYVFIKNDLVKQDSISATFGTSQIYQFSLTYNLENPNTVKGRTELALPSDTNYQQVLISSIDPKPEQVTVDEDGNWLAEYILEPKAKIAVKANGNIKLSYFPKNEYATDLSSDQYLAYTQAKQYWESDNQTVIDLAKQYSNPQQIYDYLINNFSYNYDRLKSSSQRMGALQAIKNPNQAICMEFTDAFIALARAAGIPAREHNGYAYTENDKLRPLSLNQDILHAWPEYYDKTKKQWIQIDPTWGNTTGGLNFFDKFDLDHISFVRHGVDSSYPITAGSYKYAGVETKDVEISFSNDFDIEEAISFVGKLPDSGITGLPIFGIYGIKNNSNIALYQYPLSSKLIHNGSVLKDDNIVINSLPPFGSYQQNLNYQSSWKDRGGVYTLEISSNDEQKLYNFELKPLINYWLLIPAIFFLATILLIIMIIYRNKKKSIIKYRYPILQPRLIKK